MTVGVAGGPADYKKDISNLTIKKRNYTASLHGWYGEGCNPVLNDFVAWGGLTFPMSQSEEPSSDILRDIEFLPPKRTYKYSSCLNGD
jgi:hypothetical protein